MAAIALATRRPRTDGVGRRGQIPEMVSIHVRPPSILRVSQKSSDYNVSGNEVRVFVEYVYSDVRP